MANLNEIEILSTAENQAILQANEARNPVEFALALSKHPYGKLLAGQLKARQKAAKKIPDWVQAGCLFDPQSVEQATHQALAAAKPWGKGTLAVDLTCGTGVDAAAMSRHFEKVIAVEADEYRAALARHNFARLGLGNIEVVHARAEAWLQQFSGLKAALIYLDPARRDAINTRLHDVGRGEPDFYELRHKLMLHADRVMLKTSPMFDYREGMQKLGAVKAAFILSHKGECKEVLYEMVPGHRLPPELLLIMLRAGHQWHWLAKAGGSIAEPAANAAYLIDPDVALCMTAQATGFLHHQEPGISFSAWHNDGYFFSAQAPTLLPAHVYEIISVHPFKPQQIRKELKAQGIARVQVGRRNFPFTPEQIRAELKMADGGGHFLLCTEDRKGNRLAYVCRRN